MWNCNLVVTLTKSNVKLMIVNLDYVVFVKNKHIYQFAINFLMYVMFDIRLDIIYVVSIINRYVFNFNKFHWVAIKRIFRYLRNTFNFRLIFVEKLISLINYIDVDWVDDRNTRRSIFEYVFNIESEIINWFFKRQFIVTLSTCEIEYMNQIQIVKKIIWLFELLNELQRSNKNFKFFVVYKIHSNTICLVVIITYCDNIRTQTLVKNST